MRRARGFTIIEIMIVVAVIAILAAIAFPSYTEYVMRSKISEAVGTLSDMRAKMEQYFLDNRSYANACQPGTVAPLPTGKYFSFECSNLGGATYTVTATGVAELASFVYTIDQSNARVTVSVPTGWAGTGATCWVLKKDGSC
jgi:type IV pilus assembly protein PilE